MSLHAASHDSPLPTPPFVPIPGMANVRDIGGYPTRGLHRQPNSSIRRGLIYRGGEPSRITPEGRTAFKALGIKKVYDIRTINEIGTEKDDTIPMAALRQPIVDLEGAERIHLNVFAEDGTIQNKTESVKNWEKLGKNTTEADAIFNPQRFIAKASEVLDNGSRLVPLFAHLAQPNPAPIYLHCTAGKDRTGTVIMLLFRLAGVPKHLVVEEYALTDLGLREETPKLVETLLKAPNLGLDEETVKQLVVAKKEYMSALCDVLDEKYGGAERYFRDVLKMSAGDVQAIRRALVVGKRPIFGEEENSARKVEIWPS